MKWIMDSLVRWILFGATMFIDSTDLGDAQTRRETARAFLNSPAADAVAEQTPTDRDAVETLDELLDTPVPAKKEGESAPEVDAILEEEQEEEEDEEIDPNETDEEREAREARKAAKTGGEPGADELTPEQEQVKLRSEVFVELTNALDQTDYPIPELGEGKTEEEVAKGVQELTARLQDAHAMYGIMAGKGADGIFERILKFQGQQAHDHALREVMKYAEKVGLIESTGSADDGKDKNAPATETPREKELRIENEKLKRQVAAVPAGPTEAQQRANAVALKAMTAAEEYATDKLEISEEDWKEFVLPNLRGIGQNKAIFNRCARGNFVDLIQIVDRVNARLTGKRVATNNTRLETRQARDKKFPKVVKGEDRTARRPAAKPTRDLSKSEDRIAAAKDALRAS